MSFTRFLCNMILLANTFQIATWLFEPQTHLAYVQIFLGCGLMNVFIFDPMIKERFDP